MKNQRGWAEPVTRSGLDRKAAHRYSARSTRRCAPDPVARACGRAPLPSTRELALRLGVSRSAVVAPTSSFWRKATSTGQDGLRHLISSDLPEPVGARERSKAADDAARSAASPAGRRESLRMHIRRDDERPFNLGRTLLDARTVELWRKLSAGVFARSVQHLGYTDPRGLAEFADDQRLPSGGASVRCDPAQVIVTAGTQHAIDIILRVLLARQRCMGRGSRLFAHHGALGRRREGPARSGSTSRHRCRRGHQRAPKRARCL